MNNLANFQFRREILAHQIAAEAERRAAEDARIAAESADREARLHAYVQKRARELAHLPDAEFDAAIISDLAIWKAANR